MSDRLACPCCGVAGCTPELVMALADLEKAAGHQAVTSGYRCEQHQSNLRLAWVRGKIEWDKDHPGEKYTSPEPALHSKHSTGTAIDVLCAKESQPDLIAKAGSAGFCGVGVGDGFLHLDLGPVRAWVY